MFFIHARHSPPRAPHSAAFTPGRIIHHGKRNRADTPVSGASEDPPSTLLQRFFLSARFFHTSLTHRTPAGASPPAHFLHSSRTGEGDVLRTQDGAGTLPECPCWRRERCVTGAYWMRIVSGAFGRHRGSFLCIRRRHSRVVHVAVLCFGGVWEAPRGFPLYQSVACSCGSCGCALFLKRRGSTADLSFVSCDTSTRSGSVGETSGRRSFLLRKHASPCGEHQPRQGCTAQR